MNQSTPEYYKLCKFLHEIRIVQICKQLGSIFDPINKVVCSKCPQITTNLTGLTGIEMNGCCTFCAEHNGYWRLKHQIDYLKKRFTFDSKYGFFNNTSKRCRLPRVNRSDTCLAMTCDAMKLKDDTLDLIHQLNRELWFHRDHLIYQGVKIREKRYNLIINRKG
jgi:hypothetical protein